MDYNGSLFEQLKNFVCVCICACENNFALSAEDNNKSTVYFAVLKDFSTECVEIIVKKYNALVFKLKENQRQKQFLFTCVTVVHKL